MFKINKKGQKALNKSFAFLSIVSLVLQSLSGIFFLTPTFAQEDTSVPTPIPTIEAAVVTSTPEITPTPVIEIAATPTPITTITPTVTAIPTTISEEPKPDVLAASLPQEQSPPAAGDLLPSGTDQTSAQLNPSISTDKSDYTPNETAIISGKDLKPNTEYKIVITADKFLFEDKITTTETGTFIYSFPLGGVYRPNYNVEIKEGDSIVATTTFTDGVVPQVVINEFSSQSNPEWVELYNNSTNSVDLSGWLLYFDDNFSIQSINLTGTIPGNSYLVKETPDSWLNNGGDLITIKDSLGSVVNQVSYGGGSGKDVTAPGNGQSAHRCSNGSGSWQITSSVTKGFINDCSSVPGGGGSGSIWTTDGSCGTDQQDVNHYPKGHHVYINGSGFNPNTSYDWDIEGKPGGASCDPNQDVALGSYQTDANGGFCFDAYTVANDDCGEYGVNFGDKKDNYQVDQDQQLCGNGSLDSGETCDGGVCCNTDCTFKSAQTECRASAGVCDVAEMCTGSSATCPTDNFASSDIVCRGQAGVCDIAENCTGSSINCPEDTFVSFETSCSDGDICNGEETCDGLGVCISGTALVCTPYTCDAENGCGLPICGDDTLDTNAGEQCDDGNITDGDGCSANCQTEVPACTDGTGWATSVVFSDQGTLKNGGTIFDSARTDPLKILGANDGIFFSLGYGGNVILSFNQWVTDTDGNDLSFHETTWGRTTYPIEKAEVFVSQDNSNWQSLGEISNKDNILGISYKDISITGWDWIKYVKLVDTTNDPTHASNADGFDLDAIDVVYGVCEEPQPESFCGDGEINQEREEQCDEGETNGQVCTPEYGSSCNYCSDSCQEVTVPGSFCGDNVENGNEQCDGTNDCLADCTLKPVVDIDPVPVRIIDGQACGVGSAWDDDGLKVNVTNWKPGYKLLGRYFIAGGSFVSWLDLSTLGPIDVIGTNASFFTPNSGNSPAGPAGWEVKVVDALNNDISNIDSLNYTINSDASSEVCGGVELWWYKVESYKDTNESASPLAASGTWTATVRDSAGASVGTVLNTNASTVDTFNKSVIYNNIKLPHGVYTLSENVNPGYQFSWGRCMDSTDAVPYNSSFYFDVGSAEGKQQVFGPDVAGLTSDGSPWNTSADAFAQLNLTAGKRIYCVLYNKPFGSITVDKVTNPAGDPQSFNFYLNKNGQSFDNFSLTDSADPYSNTALLPGTYSLGESGFEGWTNDSGSCFNNGNPVSNNMEIVVNPGDQVSCVFNNTKLGSIWGRKFKDRNANGVKNGNGDSYLNDWTINLYDDEWGWVKGMQTGDDNTEAGNVDQGQYKFINLTPGNYYVCEELKSGWMQTKPSEGPVYEDGDEGPFCYAVELSAGVTEKGLTFGNFELGKVQGMKYEDQDGDGLPHENGEAYLNDWTLRLYKDWGGEPIEITTSNTGQTGQYKYTDLSLGTYQVCEVLKEGWTQTWPKVGDVPVADDGTLRPAYGQAVANESGTEDEGGVCWRTIIDSSGDFNQLLRFGNTQFGSISGYKYEDVDGNGTQGEGELGLNKWTIFLDGDDDGVLDAEERSLITDDSGYYKFENLIAGDYQVCEESQENWQITQPVGSNCQQATVFPGQDTPNIDFGNFRLGEINGWKWDDYNGNGFWDEEEPALNNWEICLGSAAEPSPSPTPDDGPMVPAPRLSNCVLTGNGDWPDGYYEFTGLSAGNYRLSETAQPGWNPTRPVDPNYYDLTISSGSTYGGELCNGEPRANGEITDRIQQLICLNFGNELQPITLTLSKVNNILGSMGPGGTVTYTLTVTNTSKIIAHDVSVRDTLPLGFNYVAGSTTGGPAEPTVTGQNLVWSLGDFAPDAIVTITYQAKTDSSLQEGKYPNVALAWGYNRQSEIERTIPDRQVTYTDPAWSWVSLIPGVSFSAGINGTIQQVLGASTGEVLGAATGSETYWLIMAIIMIVSGLFLIKRKRFIK